MSNANPHSAAPSILGYLYQFRYSLLLILEEECEEIALETLDDVTVSLENIPQSLYQLKLHADRNASLADMSVDLWKTFRVWISQLALLRGKNPPNLFLVTTSAAKEEEGAYYLRHEGRDVAKAQALFNVAAADSKNKDLKEAFASYSGLSEDDKSLLFSRIRILDRSEDLEGVTGKIKAHLATTTREHQVDLFFESLDGWWVNRILSQLQGVKKGPLAYSAIRAFMIEFRDSLHPEDLPLNELWVEAFSPDKTGEDSHLFVRQLISIAMEDRHIRAAVQNYYRAFSHRSKWLREQLVVEEEWSKYEDHLIRELENRRLYTEFDESDNSSMVTAGKLLYQWSQAEVHLPIRRRIEDRSIMRGAFHLLADENPPRVWWHPQFLERLEALASRPIDAN
jgi:hypothetical protein